MTGFQHSIAGGQGNLIAAFMQSPNFLHGVQGWQIARDGSAEFNNLVIRGTFMGTDFIINSDGAFFYSPSEGAGNLKLSITASLTGGTDQFGNHYVPLTGWYDNAGGFFTQIGAGFLTYGTGSLASGWTANTSIQNDGSGNLFINANASVFLNNSASTGGPVPTQSGLVTTGPSNTTSSFPAAAAGHTHTLNFFLPTANHTHAL